MIPFLLFAAAIGIATLLMLLLFARRVDRRFQQQDPDEALAELTQTLERLEGRIQNLEAIVTTEAWDALPHEPLTDTSELSDEEKAARLAQRQGMKRNKT